MTDNSIGGDASIAVSMTPSWALSQLSVLLSNKGNPYSVPVQCQDYLNSVSRIAFDTRQLNTMKKTLLALWNRSLDQEQTSMVIPPEQGEVIFRCFIADALAFALKDSMLSEQDASALATVWGSTGYVLARNGDFDEAQLRFTRAIDIIKRCLPLSGLPSPLLRPVLVTLYSWSALAAVIRGTARSGVQNVRLFMECVHLTLDIVPPLELEASAGALFQVASAAANHFLDTQQTDELWKEDADIVLGWLDEAAALSLRAQSPRVRAACLRLRSAILLLQQKFSEALEAAETAGALEPTHPAGLLLTVRVSLALGDFDVLRDTSMALAQSATAPVAATLSAIEYIIDPRPQMSAMNLKATTEQLESLTEDMTKALVQSHPQDPSAQTALAKHLYRLIESGPSAGSSRPLESRGLQFALELKTLQEDGTLHIDDQSAAASLVTICYYQAMAAFSASGSAGVSGPTTLSRVLDKSSLEKLNETIQWCSVTQPFLPFVSDITLITAIHRLLSRAELGSGHVPQAYSAACAACLAEPPHVDLNQLLMAEIDGVGQIPTSQLALSLQTAFLLAEVAVARRDTRLANVAVSALQASSASPTHLIAFAQMAYQASFIDGCTSVLTHLPTSFNRGELAEAQLAIALLINTSDSCALVCDAAQRVLDTVVSLLNEEDIQAAEPEITCGDIVPLESPPQVPELAAAATPVSESPAALRAIALTCARLSWNAGRQIAKYKNESADDDTVDISDVPAVNLYYSARLFYISSKLAELSIEPGSTAGEMHTLARRAIQLSVAFFMEASRRDSHSCQPFLNKLTIWAQFTDALAVASSLLPEERGASLFISAVECACLLSPTDIPQVLEGNFSVAQAKDATLPALAAAACTLGERGMGGSIIPLFLQACAGADITSLKENEGSLSVISQAYRLLTSPILLQDQQTALVLVRSAIALAGQIGFWPEEEAHWMTATAWNVGLSEKQAGRIALAEPWWLAAKEMLVFCPTLSQLKSRVEEGYANLRSALSQ